MLFARTSHARDSRGRVTRSPALMSASSHWRSLSLVGQALSPPWFSTCPRRRPTS
jgi:hypothetical protein